MSIYFEGISATDIFKNYYNILNNSSYDLTNPNTVLNILEDDSQYSSFKNKLFEGMSGNQVEIANVVCDSQRDFLIQEMSQNIINTDIAIGYAISYFPILCDIYCTDILGNAIIYKSVDTPIFSIPRMKMVASVENSNGVTNTWTFPRAMFLIRSTPEEFTLDPGKSHSLFNLSKNYPKLINEEIALINKKYFLLKNITVEVENTKTKEKHQITHSLHIRPDSRSQLNYEFELVSDKDPTIMANCTIIGHINWDSGRLQYNMTAISSNPDYTFTLKSGIFSCLFTSKTSNIGRVKVSVKMSGQDLDISNNEDFEYDLDVETLQNYSDIYNIDLIRTLSTAIKGQILLNRDHDIASLLESAIPDTKVNHTFEKLLFKPIFDTAGYLSPGYYQSIFQNIIPKLSLISRYMYLNTNLIPNYLLCGVKSAALLESLQEFSISFPEMRHGISGYDSAYGHQNVKNSSFRHYTILMSHTIPDNLIYVTYKPESKEEFHFANIVNFIYKPLYLIEEITNSQKRVFIRTRNSINLLNTSTIGCLELFDINDAMTTYDYQPKQINWF